MTLLQTLQARVEPPLLLIEQTVEQYDGRASLVGLLVHLFPQGLASRTLLLPPDSLFGGVEIQAVEVLAFDSPSPYQLQQYVFDRHVQPRLQLAGNLACRRLLDRRFGGVQECALPGKPGSAGQPKTPGIESWDRLQGVVAAPVGIAGEVAQHGQFPEYGHIHLGSQRGLHLRHGEGLEALKEVQQRLEDKANRLHNVRIQHVRPSTSTILTLQPVAFEENAAGPNGLF